VAFKNQNIFFNLGYLNIRVRKREKRSKISSYGRTSTPTKREHRRGHTPNVLTRIRALFGITFKLLKLFPSAYTWVDIVVVLRSGLLMRPSSLLDTAHLQRCSLSRAIKTFRLWKLPTLDFDKINFSQQTLKNELKLI